jgi:hypothetical protein
MRNAECGVRNILMQKMGSDSNGKCRMSLIRNKKLLIPHSEFRIPNSAFV